MSAVDPDGQHLPQPRQGITTRSIVLGLVGVVAINAITPYNDYALNNTFLVGNNLPLAVVMIIFLFALLVNGPLSRFAPGRAFRSGEMATMFTLWLVGCALPSSGLMRKFPGSLIGPIHHAQSRAEYLQLLEDLNLPRWLLPRFAGEGPRDWISDPIVTGFYQRWTDPGPIPLAAWVQPALTWGVFLCALWGSLIFLMVLLRRQWVENERLPFPLVRIQLALLEEPRPGRWFSPVFNQGFWIAFTAIFLIHGWNGLAVYHPGLFPPIPISYDLRGVFSDPPWAAMDVRVQAAGIYFVAVGVTFFLTTSIAFSMWFFIILLQWYRMWLGSIGGDPSVPGLRDMHLGGALAYAGLIFWIGRHHWKLVLAQAFRGHRPGEPEERYLSYAATFWGLVACVAVMVIWLWYAGAGLGSAVVIVLMLLLMFVVITRIIAETGLVFGHVLIPIYRPWQILSFYGWPGAVSANSFYMGGLIQANFYDARESLSVYASHALKVNDQTLFQEKDPVRQQRRTGRSLLVWMGLTLLLAYVVSFSSTLWTHYHYAATLDEQQEAPINRFGTEQVPEALLLSPTLQHMHSPAISTHDPLTNLGAGFGITAVLGYLRLRWTFWPLHPVGFLMLPTTPARVLWFSIFLGWLCKVVIVRFGGAGLYQKAAPFFLGMIVGECIAAGTWAVTSVVLNAMGIAYHPIHILPR
jgi:hypothetical protein